MKPISRRLRNTSPAYDSRSAGNIESGVSIVKEKVRHVGMSRTRAALCDSREITCFTPVVREICSSNFQQISSWNPME